MAITSTLFEDSYINFMENCKHNVMDKIKRLEEDKVNVKCYVQKVYIIALNRHCKDTLSTEELNKLQHNLMLQLKYHNVIDRLLDKYKDLLQRIY